MRNNIKVFFIIYYSTFNAINLDIFNNFPISTSYLYTTNVVYKFKRSLE